MQIKKLFRSSTLLSFKWISFTFSINDFVRFCLNEISRKKKKKLRLKIEKHRNLYRYPSNLIGGSSSNFTDIKTRFDSKIWLTIMTVSIGVCRRQTASRRYSCKSRGKFAIRLQHELGRNLPLRLIAEIVRKSCCLLIRLQTSTIHVPIMRFPPFEFPMLLWKVRLGIFKNNRINSSFQSRFKESKNINKTIISHFIFPTKIPDTKTDLIIFLLRAFLIAFPFKKFNSEKWDEFRFPIILYQGI